jgi:pimeloyl-ACP methyl ester carboxylesterase
MSQSMKQAIANAELVTIEAAGHLSNLEQPQRFNDALAAFLDHRV